MWAARFLAAMVLAAHAHPACGFLAPSAPTLGLRGHQARAALAWAAEARGARGRCGVCAISMQGMDQKEYSRNERLREEIESPFRKARQFLVPWLIASAALAAFISGTRLLAILSGVKGYDLQETALNLAVNAAAIGGMGFIWVRDKKAEGKSLERIARSSVLAKMRVEVAGETGRSAMLPMKAFRRSQRVTIVAGGAEVVQAAKDMATEGREALTDAGVVVVPVQLLGTSPLAADKVEAIRTAAGISGGPAGEGEGEGAAGGEDAWISPCCGRAVNPDEWQRWLRDEVEQAKEQGLDPAAGIVLNVERSGYIKKRSVGVPNWVEHAAVSKKINSVRYGMPSFDFDKSK